MDSDYSESDLTEFDDDDYGGPSKKKGKPAAHEYRIRNALKVPRATTYTAQALYDQMVSGDINLEPEYQRDVVWPEAKKIGLIDSVFRNFYIPPIIFAVIAHEDGSERKTCIDGKQRLTSIQRFMDGHIPHKDPFTGEKFWFKELPNEKPKRASSRKALPDKYKQLFSNKQIVCVEYQDITDSDEREIFQRVQLGMALTPAEKLQVISGPRADYLRSLQSKYIKTERLSGEALEWNGLRGGDFRCLAQAVFSMEKYPNITTVGDISQLEKWLALPDELSNAFVDKVDDAFSIFDDLVHNSKYKAVFKTTAKISPIEFIATSILIAVYKDQMSLAQLAAAISMMREEVRQTHVDIRMNNRVGRTMIAFIKGLKPGMLKVPAGVLAGKKVGAKRKRTQADDEDDDDEDEDYQGSAKKKTPSSNNPTPSTSRKNDSTAAPSSTPQVATRSTRSKPPVTDRLAALRAAKQSAQTSGTGSPPDGPAALRSLAGSSLSPNASSSVGTPRIPSQRQQSIGNTLEASLMASMSQSSRSTSARPTDSAPDTGWTDRDLHPHLYTQQKP